MTTDTPVTPDPNVPPASGAASEAASQAAAGTPAAESAPANTATAARSAEARELERQLDEARQKQREAEDRARENLDRWQRAQADLANYRRRAQYDREELERYATAALVAALLPVLDSFDRAWQSLPGQFRRLTWLSGVAMIHTQLRGTLERIGLTEIESDGKPFDPALHEAVDREEGDGPPHVVGVLQAGYKLHERVLRPALVKVGPPPKEAAEPPAGEASTGGEQPATGASAETESASPAASATPDA